MLIFILKILNFLFLKILTKNQIQELKKMQETLSALLITKQKKQLL